jgi:hypothetical protein
MSISDMQRKRGQARGAPLKPVPDDEIVRRGDIFATGR